MPPEDTPKEPTKDDDQPNWRDLVDKFSKDAKHEPGSALRQLGQFVFSIHQALLDSGFSKREALSLTGEAFAVIIDRSLNT